MSKSKKKFKGPKSYYGSIKTTVPAMGQLKFAAGVGAKTPPGMMRVAVSCDSRHGGCGKGNLIDAPIVLPETPLSFVCGHCGKRIVAHMAMDSTELHIYGDESTGPGDPPDIVLYGLLMFKSVDVAGVTKEIISIVKASGVQDFPSRETRLHCRQLFSPQQRIKTSWICLSDENIWELLEKILRSMLNYRPFFSLGVVDYAQYIEAATASGGLASIQKETVYPLAFQAALAQMGEWSWLGDDFTRKLWVDRQRTPVSLTGSAKVKVERLLTHEKVVLQTVDNDDDKPLLMDIADLLTYIAGRALSSKTSLTSERCKKLHPIIPTNICRAYWDQSRFLLSKGVTG